MALDSYKVKETKKTSETTEQKYSIEEFRRLIDSLPVDVSHEIDQQWIKENEGKEFSFSTKNSQSKDDEVLASSSSNPSIKDIYSKVAGINTSDKKTNNDDIAQKLIEEFNRDLEILTSKQNVPNSVPPIDEIETQVPMSNQEEALEEVVRIDDSALIEEINNRIDNKYNRLVSDLSNLYNSESINQEANHIKNDLQNIMDIKNRSLEELKKVDEALNGLISRFSKLSQKAEEIKVSDDLKIEKLSNNLRNLNTYQNGLQNKYGKYWFAKMSPQEKEQYIQLYSVTHNIPKIFVEKQIDDSISKAYEEITSSKKQDINQSIQNVQSVQSEQNNQTQTKQFKGEAENMIRFNGKKALEKLQQVYSNLQSASSEQIDEFRVLYQSLSSLSKFEPTSLDEEQQKFTKLLDLTDRINQLQASITGTQTFESASKEF